MHVRFVGEIVEQEFDDYLRYLNANMDRTERGRTMTAILFDAREVGRVPPNIRRKMADWIRDNTLQTKRTCAGFAYVIESPLVRGLLTAILWLVPIPAPHTVEASVGEADAFLIGKLGEHGVRITASRFSLAPPAPPRRV